MSPAQAQTPTVQAAASRAGSADETRVLVVEDDDNVRALVAAALHSQGYAVQAVADGRAAVAAVRRVAPALVLLDVMLPDLDGFTVARRLRSDHHAVAVVFLTARSEEEDRIEGLDLGGDDYITKPFSIDELFARVRAVLRRTEGGRTDALLTLGDLELDEATMVVRRSGIPIELTTTEFNLLRHFLCNPRMVLSKAQLLRAVWGYEVGDDNLVETYVSYLRKKLDPLGPPLLHTIRGSGYALRPAEWT